MDLGGGIGNSLGGALIGAYGLRVVLRISGAVAFLTGFLYFLFNICYLRPKANEKNTTFDKAEEIQ